MKYVKSVDKMVKKIKLSKVEEYLELDLQRNIISLGFDVAVHSTGIALIRTTPNYLILEHTHKLITPKDVKEDKAQDLFTVQLDNYRNKLVQKCRPNATIIENCFFGKSVTVLKALARCSGLARDRFKAFSDRCEYRYPREIRKLLHIQTGKLKGHYLKKEIVRYINEALELELKNKDHDIADAIACALVGLIKE